MSLFMNYIMLIAISFFISFIAIRFSKPIAIKFGLVDAPCARKVHSGSIPLVGGIGIFLGVSLTLALFTPKTTILSLFILSAGIIVVLGMLDDYYDLPVKPRVVCQALVAGIMIFGADIYLNTLGDLFGTGPLMLGVWGKLITVIAVIGVINAFNMVDGIDGLAGMLSVVTFLSLAFLFSANDGLRLQISLLFIAAISAYLMFNLEWPSKRFNKIFMGDAGSMLIGLTVVWLLIDGSQGEKASFKPATALWLIAIPLLDMAAIMVRRVRKGKSPFKPDRDHLHHIFLRAGLTAKQTLFVISGISLLLASFGIILDKYEVAQWINISSFILLFLVYLYVINHIWKILTFIRRVLKINELNQE